MDVLRPQTDGDWLVVLRESVAVSDCGTGADRVHRRWGKRYTIPNATLLPLE